MICDLLWLNGNGIGISPRNTHQILKVRVEAAPPALSLPWSEPTKLNDCVTNRGMSLAEGELAMKRAITSLLGLAAALSVSACAGDAFGPSPSEPTASIVAKPAIDPACSALAARIDGLRKDGVVERAEAASKGKGSTVSIKRASLGQLTELEKANAEFQAKCSTVPRSAALPAPAAVGAAPAAEAKVAAAKTVKTAKSTASTAKAAAATTKQ